jgi:hypothetical protein
MRERESVRAPRRCSKRGLAILYLGNRRESTEAQAQAPRFRGLRAIFLSRVSDIRAAILFGVDASESEGFPSSCRCNVVSSFRPSPLLSTHSSEFLGSSNSMYVFCISCSEYFPLCVVFLSQDSYVAQTHPRLKVLNLCPPHTQSHTQTSHVFHSYCAVVRVLFFRFLNFLHIFS